MKKKIQIWVLAAILIICTVTMVFTSCTDNADNAVAEPEQPLSDKEMLMTLYGENKKITDGNYDKSLAVKCINGTFVGKRSGGIVAYKGIPFVGQQPVGELRWKAPVDYVADESVYEAYYNAKSPYQREDLSEKASLYVQGEDCLCLNIWKAEGSSAATKPVMVWIHGGAFEMGGTVDPLYEGHNCGHSVELPVIFNHHEITLEMGWTFDATFSKTMRRMWVQFAKTGNPSLSADQSPDGKAKEWPLYDLENKQLMIFDEFNIHPEKESQRKILDWDRTYFLTKYYCL